MHIEIPTDLLNEFNQKDFGSENSDPDGNPKKPELTPVERGKLKAAKKFGEWASNSFDKNMKLLDAPGLAGVLPEELSGMLVDAWEDEILASEWIEDLPKYFCGVTLLSIAGANAAAIVRNRRKNEIETHSGNAGEQPDEVGSKDGEKRDKS